MAGVAPVNLFKCLIHCLPSLKISWRRKQLAKVMKLIIFRFSFSESLFTDASDIYYTKCVTKSRLLSHESIWKKNLYHTKTCVLYIYTMTLFLQNSIFFNFPCLGMCYKVFTVREFQFSFSSYQNSKSQNNRMSNVQLKVSKWVLYYEKIISKPVLL